ILASGDEHLHAHFAAGAALDAMRLAALSGRPYSVTAHACDIFAQPRNLDEKLSRAAAVFTGCEYNLVRLRKLVPRADVHEVGLPECVLAPWGYLAAPGDAEGLAAALRSALALGPAARRAAGDAARAWVREHADVDRETARMAEVIAAKLAAGRSPAAGAGR